MVTAEKRKWSSSLIKSTEYTPDSQELIVEFANGKFYTYSEVTESEYEDFCSAESQGSFFGKNFRGKKPFTKETEDDNTESK
jgi:hypothetical protein